MHSFCISEKNLKLFSMPTNLNALIRYKTLDTCFRNRYGEWTLKKLAKKCTEALQDAKGRKKRVSKRTIQDDIRVMRSDILGFEAPIEVQDGKYFYSDPDYSIFKTGIREMKLLKELYREMLHWWETEKPSRLESMLKKMAEVTGETFRTEEEEMEKEKSSEKIVSQNLRILAIKLESLGELKKMLYEDDEYGEIMKERRSGRDRSEDAGFMGDHLVVGFRSTDEEKPLFSWKEILEVV